MRTRSSSSRKMTRSIPLALGLLAALTFGTPPASADSALVVAQLPSARSHTSAVWVQDSAYIFGGETNAGTLDEIVRFTPSTGAVTVMASKLPAKTSNSSAVAVGSVAYIFGGQAAGVSTNRILRYDPSTDTIAVMAAVLPVASSDTAAFWDGSNVYIAEGAGSRRLLKYHPATDTISVMASLLSQGVFGPSAAWTGSYGYILAAKFYKIDTASGTFTTTSSVYTGTKAGAVFHGSRIYMLGGSVGSSDLYQIQDYNPVSDKRWPMTTQLPGRRGFPSAVGDGTNLYVFGGIDRGGQYTQCSPAGPVTGCPARGRLSEIVRYFPASGPVKNVRVIPGTSLGQNSIFWDYPDGQTFAMFSYPTAFKIYRRVGPLGELTLLDQTGGTSLSYADMTCPIAQTCWYQVSMVNAEGEGERSLLVPALGWRP